MTDTKAVLIAHENAAKVPTWRRRRARARWLVLLGTVLVATATSAHASVLSPQEKKIVAAAQGEDQRAISLLETLVNINSGFGL